MTTRSIAPCLALLLCAALPMSAAEPSRRPWGDHVRPTDYHMRLVIDDGVRRSLTMQRLITRLERSDVTVYVECSLELSDLLAGQVTFLGATPLQRYVRVTLSCALNPTAMIATLGHELQHAVEIADAPSIVDEASLRSAYMAMGFRTDVYASRCAFDSYAARIVGDQVRREIVAPPPQASDGQAMTTRP